MLIASGSDLIERVQIGRIPATRQKIVCRGSSAATRHAFCMSVSLTTRTASLFLPPPASNQSMARQNAFKRKGRIAPSPGSPHEMGHQTRRFSFDRTGILHGCSSTSPFVAQGRCAMPPMPSEPGGRQLPRVHYHHGLTVTPTPLASGYYRY